MISWLLLLYIAALLLVSRVAPVQQHLHRLALNNKANFRLLAVWFKLIVHQSCKFAVLFCSPLFLFHGQCFPVELWQGNSSANGISLKGQQHWKMVTNSECWSLILASAKSLNAQDEGLWILFPITNESFHVRMGWVEKCERIPSSSGAGGGVSVYTQ